MGPFSPLEPWLWILPWPLLLLLLGIWLWLWRRKPSQIETPSLESAAQPEMEPNPTPAPPPLAEPWRVFGASVRGASHERSGLPNQDALGWLPESATGPPLILALADGHGSAKNFRSDVGAQLAVSCSLEVLQEFCARQEALTDLTAVKRAVEEELPLVLERRWKNAVESHLAAHPLLVNEVTRLEAASGEGARKAVEKQPLLAYGATILALLLHDAYLASLQLGDGDIVAVSPSGEISRPMAADARLFANETTSLCGADAWRDFRTYFQGWAASPPALILVSTDGYSNAFSTDAGFLTVASDLLDLLRSDGLDAVRQSLPTWLEEASRQGSGDDVTAGVLIRCAAIEQGPVVMSRDNSAAEGCITGQQPAGVSIDFGNDTTNSR